MADRSSTKKGEEEIQYYDEAKVPTLPMPPKRPPKRYMRKDNKDIRSSRPAKLQSVISGIPDFQLEDSPEDPNEGQKSDDDNFEEQSRKWTIDRRSWEECIDQKDTHKLTELLRQKKLLDNFLLHRALIVFNLDNVRAICDGICQYIAQTSKHVLHVYTAIGSSGIISFVVVLETNDVELPQTFKYYIKNISDPSPRENIKIRNQEMRDIISKPFVDDPSLLIRCINKHSTQLKNDHSNICRITYSGYKWKKGEKQLKKVDCIALYVYLKGRIPLGEKLLPKALKINSRWFPVDVREGYVFACQGKGPTDTFDNLVMGCSIGVEPRTKDITMSGTLGGFFELGGDDFCISAAHSFLTANELRRLNQKDGFKFFNKNFYQPYDNYIKPFGKYNSSVYTEGGFNEATGESVTGVDVICIKMDNRHPKTGGFPKAIDGGQEPHTEYVNGKVYTRQEIYKAITEKPDRRFFKYGCGTGWTTGHFRGDGAMFLTPHPKQNKLGDFNICLHNQIEICSSDTESDFAGKSDSGSLVFMEVNDELVAIGMIVASMPVELVSFVTPLDEILQALNLRAKGMKTFNNEANVGSELSEPLPSPSLEISDLKDDMSDVKNDVQEMQSGIISLECVMSNVGDSISNIEIGMTEVKSDFQTLQSSVTSLESSMLNMETGMSDVKSDVQSMQSSVSSLKSGLSVVQTDVASLKKSIKETNDGIKGIMSLLQNIQGLNK